MNRFHESIEGVGGILHHKYILFGSVDSFGDEGPCLINQDFHIFAEPCLCVELHAFLQLAFMGHDCLWRVAVTAVVEIGVSFVNVEVLEALLAELVLRFGLHFCL